MKALELYVAAASSPEPDAPGLSRNRRRRTTLSGPFEGSSAHLGAHLGVVVLRLECHMRQIHVASRVGLTDALLEGLLALRRAFGVDRAAPGVTDPRARVSSHEAHIARRLELSYLSDRDRSLPIEELRAEFNLSRDEISLLLAAAAPGLTPAFAPLYDVLSGGEGQTVRFLSELVGVERARRLHDCFSAESPLVRHHLVRLRGEGPSARVDVDRAVLLTLRGAPDALEQAYGGAVRLRAPAPLSWPELVLGDEVRERVLDWQDRGRIGWDRPRLLLTGPPGSGRRTALAAAQARIGKRLVEVDLAGLMRRGESLKAQLEGACRDARVRGAALVLHGDEVFGRPDRATRVASILRELFTEQEVHIALTARNPSRSLAAHLPGLVEVSLGTPSRSAQVYLWEVALGDHADADPELPRQLGRRYRLSPAAIFGAARRASGCRHGLTLAGLDAAVVDEALARLGGLGACSGIAPSAARSGWSCQPGRLPRELFDQVHDLMVLARAGQRSIDGWGRRPESVSCVFTGASDEAAEVASIVAQGIGRPLVRVDVGALLARAAEVGRDAIIDLFDEARAAGLVLLLDDHGARVADDPTPDEAVLELLLQMERFQGLSILRTHWNPVNQQLFSRRIRFQVRLTKPGWTPANHPVRARRRAM